MIKPPGNEARQPSDRQLEMKNVISYESLEGHFLGNIHRIYNSQDSYEFVVSITLLFCYFYLLRKIRYLHIFNFNGFLAKKTTLWEKVNKTLKLNLKYSEPLTGLMCSRHIHGKCKIYLFFYHRSSNRASGSPALVNNQHRPWTFAR